MLGSAVLLVVAVLVTLISPVLAKPERWSVQHPAAALSLWVTAFVVGCTAFVASVLAVVGVALTQRPGNGSSWPTAIAVVLVVWTALGALGAMLALLGTRAERSHDDTHATRVKVLLLTACATYRTRTVSGVEVSFVHSDEPFALSLRDGGPRIVVSQVLDDALEPAQLRAVIEHERTHLQWRHNLIVSIADLAQSCTPWLPAGCAFRRSARLLTELAADDRAARICGVDTCAEALERLHLMAATPGADLRALRVRSMSVRHHVFGSAARIKARSADPA